jgi:2-oxo-3-hexenedioate decarboxylase
MSEEDMLGAIEWVAHGFEMVQSIYPDWRFGGADAIAAGGMHGALLLGPKLLVADATKPDLARALKNFAVTLRRDGETVDTGKATNVLGGPLLALAHLADELTRDASNPPLAAGEIVTTGTLTRAFPVAAGERWTTTLDGIALDGITVELVPWVDALAAVPASDKG